MSRVNIFTRFDLLASETPGLDPEGSQLRDHDIYQNLFKPKEIMGQESRTYLAARILNDGKLVSSASVNVFQLTFISSHLRGFLSLFE